MGYPFINGIEDNIMTEEDYIKAGDLAKIRAAKTILKDVISYNDDHAREVMKLLFNIEEKLADSINLTA